MSTLFSCFFFNLLSLNPHSAHLYIIESPISFSGSMSPPQHAHFMTSKCHKEMKCYFFLWSSWLLKLYASSSFFFIVISVVTAYIGDAVSNYTFSPLYNNNLQISIRQETAIVVELDKITQEVLQACFACYRYM